MLIKINISKMKSSKIVALAPLPSENKINDVISIKNNNVCVCVSVSLNHVLQVLSAL